MMVRINAIVSCVAIAAASTAKAGDVGLAAGLEVEAPVERFDLAAQTLQLRMSRPADRCDYQLVVDGQRLPKHGTATFRGEQPWTWLAVRWQDPGGRVLRILLTCYDVDGHAGRLELIPIEPPTLTVPRDKVDSRAGKLEFQLSRPTASCTYDLAYDGAEPVGGEVTFNGAPAGTWLTVSWPRPTANTVLLRIELTCVDTTGGSATIELFPWQLDVPHEEVSFESGKWEIAENELPKLERALTAVETAIRRYGEVVDIKLYVIGYTDTVGNRKANRRLSLHRARSIAGYFAKKGVRVPIAYAGFGEDLLAVPTADGTDEIRNRRARYILAAEEPEKASWSRLQK